MQTEYLVLVLLLSTCRNSGQGKHVSVKSAVCLDTIAVYGCLRCILQFQPTENWWCRKIMQWLMMTFCILSKTFSFLWEVLAPCRLSPQLFLTLPFRFRMVLGLCGSRHNQSAGSPYTNSHSYQQAVLYFWPWCSSSWVSPRNCNGKEESDLKQALSNVREEFVQHRLKHWQSAISLRLSQAVTFFSLPQQPPQASTLLTLIFLVINALCISNLSRLCPWSVFSQSLSQLMKPSLIFFLSSA